MIRYLLIFLFLKVIKRGQIYFSSVSVALGLGSRVIFPRKSGHAVKSFSN